MLKTDRKEGQHERKVRTRTTMKVKGKQEMKTRKKKQHEEKKERQWRSRYFTLYKLYTTDCERLE